MTTEEHLEKIVAKCRELLAGAEKRTPEKWAIRKDYFDRDQPAKFASYNVFPHRGGRSKPADGIGCFTELAKVENYDPNNRANAAFIASCAGPAEAGWRATIAACELAIPVSKCCDSFIRESEHAQSVMALAEQLIAAWPEELL